MTPVGLEALRDRFLMHCASLLESGVRSRHFAAALADLMHREHEAVMEVLAALGREQPACAGVIDEAVHRCQALRGALAALSQERMRGLVRNGDYLREMMAEFEQATGELSRTLIEKSLFERQAKVLESIILSYERVSQWKTFVQEILAEFHRIFPFNFFIVAFAEEHTLQFYLYYMGEYPAAVRREVRQRFTNQFLREFGLPLDSPVDVEEFLLPDGRSLDLEEIKLITVQMPAHVPQVSGILGVGYASTCPLTPQEEGVLRSLMAVMMMVVGSSKVLTRTLSELEYYSTHDPLTGIYNRRHFNEMLEYEVGRSERHRHDFCLLLLDLDDFKDINDSYGHPVGDEVLRQLSEVLRGLLRKGDLACRIGGDEFAMLLPETPLAGGMKVAEKVREKIADLQFRAPEDKRFHVTVSIGVVSFPDDARDMRELLASVDASLYHAKHLGKNVIAGLERARSRLDTARTIREHVEELRLALKSGRVVPYFQPIVDLRTGVLWGYEAVARLLEEGGEVQSAAAFIEVVEKYGLVSDLDRCIIDQALQTLSGQKGKQGDSLPRLFINLSAQEMQGRGVVGYAEMLCDRLQVPPECLVFEVLEREAIGDMSNMRRFLNRLRERGFSFALDDFGSGYNSFHYLRELHFEYVKLDGAFVRNILDSQVDHALVRNLVRLCSDLGIRTVAEFVETAEVLQALGEMGVDYVQGYHVGLPQPRMEWRGISQESG